MMPIVTVVQNRTNYALYNNRIKPKMEIHPMKTFLSLLLAIIILPLITACATPSQILADAEVKRLYEKDGGIKVYETVTLPAERFNKYGQVRIPYKESAKIDDEYYIVWQVQYLKEGNPSLSRDHVQVVRRLDSKILGESISYVRIAGDIPGPWHHSTFRCPEQAASPRLIERIFIQAK
jgi:hypothetical protein